MKHEDAQTVKASITNSYILPCDGGYLVIDTSHRRDYKRYVRDLNKLGIDLSNIRYILLTHHHHDHAGMLAQISDQCDAKIIVHEKALDPLKRGENEVGEILNFRAGLMIALIKIFGERYRFPPVIPRDEDIIVESDYDDLLRGIGIEGSILYTPGHTPDSISVVLDNGDAFVGDLSMNMPKFMGFKYRPPYVDDIDSIFAGWKKVLDAGSKTIYPGHGKPLPAERLTTTGLI
jgi:glyoxylase-like metal-dependent hydrolase (beta-lactamase superfamily II)